MLGVLLAFVGVAVETGVLPVVGEHRCDHLRVAGVPAFSPAVCEFCRRGQAIGVAVTLITAPGETESERYDGKQQC
jgi:hypothetical protein